MMAEKMNILAPEVYIPNFLKIRTKDSKLVKFQLNHAQKQLLTKIRDLKLREKPIRFIILKARQLGISTFTEAFIFNQTATQKYINSLIIAHDESATQNLFKMYRTFYENLPPELTPMTRYSNRKEITFENPSQDINVKRKDPGMESQVTVAVASNVDAGRSQTIHFLHASEVAFWDDANTLMTGLLQTVPDSPNTAVVLESTANGVGGWFYDMWQKAETGENGYIPIFLAWFVEPQYTRSFDTQEEYHRFVEEVNQSYFDKHGRLVLTEERELMNNFNLTYEQLNWRKNKIQNALNGDVEKFKQEYPSTPEEAFIASGRPRFNITVLKKYLSKAVPGTRYNVEAVGGKVEFVPNEIGHVEVWKAPEYGKYYVIGADVAEGLVLGDYSVAVVLDDDGDIAAVWRGHIDPDLFGEELVKLARLYNEAYIGVEVNNHGRTTLKTIIDADYLNIYYSKTIDKITDSITQKVGWETNQKTKRHMIDTLAKWIREKWLGIKWKTLINELITYVIDDKGLTNAQKGCFDDTVMALAIALQLYLESRGESFEPFDTNKLETAQEFQKKQKSFIDRIIEEKRRKYQGDDDLEITQ